MSNEYGGGQLDLLAHPMGVELGEANAALYPP